MKKRVFATLDGNEAVARVSHRTNEVIAIYPITPSSNMGEWADEFSAKGQKNIWGSIPLVYEMQSEAGAAGAVHGALQTGALTTTYTASQGLFLMIPNMYKIAGELTPTVFHIAARSIATSALSIFGDHSDVMSTRGTGFAMLSSNTVQEAHDFALISQAATLESRVPFTHFFDGFRVSHEVAKIELLDDEDLRSMIDDNLVSAHRARALSPDHPVMRGTAQNPDVMFQTRETVNKFYEVTPAIVQKAMDKFAKLTGRQYRNYEYVGAPDAEHVVIAMGSACETIIDTANYLNKKGQKLGLLKVRLYRPFDVKSFLEAVPASAKTICVLDRTKEPGANGEPMYLDVVEGVMEGLNSGWTKFKTQPRIIGGRYGLASKEFTPAMVVAIFENMASKSPKNHFTVGINDDVTHTSLKFDASLNIEGDDVVRAMFYGLGADGTVGANKDSIKILGEDGDRYAQGYFVYDSKKSGSLTVSHLRFGPKPFNAPYLITQANFIAIHQPVFVEKFDILTNLVKGGKFLLNTPDSAEEVWDKLPRIYQERIIEKNAKFFVINAHKIAREIGMPGRINTIMQACFFAVSDVLPREQALEQIKKSIKKTYGRKGDDVVAKNIEGVDRSISNMFEVKYGNKATSKIELTSPVTDNAPKFVREVLGEIIAGRGDDLPVSAMPIDGTFPVSTAQYEKRNIAEMTPVWNPSTCIQCGKCVNVCPHAVIRAKAYDPSELNGAPATFKSADIKHPDKKGMKYTIQISVGDCTGCGVCTQACPLKDKPEDSQKALVLASQLPLREPESKNWAFFQKLSELDHAKLNMGNLRDVQFSQPTFEFSGACAGCGSAPYLRLMSQLFGDRSIVANATGCTSIYCGNMPTTPWSQNRAGRGPAWANSLFEDNAEFGLGFSLSVQKQAEFAEELLKKLSAQVGGTLANEIIDAKQTEDVEIEAQRTRVKALREKLKGINAPEARQLEAVADMLVRKTIWIQGGDGWAYDIGFGGLDHVLASGRNVNILVVDTEAYSNTGGQQSKATPRGAIAKFASAGKPSPKKDLGMIAMSYRNVYVASVAMGADDTQTLKAFREAESYNGVSIIQAYAPCIVHGINMMHMLKHQKAVVDSGRWLMYRYDPRRLEKGENPLVLDSKEPKLPVAEFMAMENRFNQLRKSDPERAEMLARQAQADVDARWRYYKFLAEGTYLSK